jgi:hypothetical protein
MFYARTKAQSTLEYVVLIGFVVAALIAMSFYMKRGVQGRLRESVDQIGEQYDANSTTSNYTVTNNLTQNEVTNTDGSSFTNMTVNKQTKNGSEEVGMAGTTE